MAVLCPSQTSTTEGLEKKQRKKMKVVVTGGRTYSNREHLFEYMDLFHSRTPITLLIHGGAKGADNLAKNWAKSHGVKILPFEAEWEKFGPAAGPIRNSRMIDEGRPDAVIAFPGGTGTANCVAKAYDKKIPVYDGRLTTTTDFQIEKPFGLSLLSSRPARR